MAISITYSLVFVNLELMSCPSPYSVIVQAQTLPFSGNGSISGTFTLASIWGLEVGTSGTISGTALPTISVVISAIDALTKTITVVGATGVVPNLSAYTLAASSSFNVGAQTVGYPYQQVDIAAQTTPLVVSIDPSTPIVTSGLTDTQLRATPVPVSGTVTATGPLTDVQLRATPVPVSGTVTTGGLTNTQLRSAALPVSLTEHLNIDAFGRLRVASPVTLFNSKLLSDNQPLYWDNQQISGSGTSSTYNTNQASVTLGVSANTAGYRARQTYQRFAYQPGKAIEITKTGIIGVPTTGITKRIGYFDGVNGPYFKSAPNGVSVCVRSNVTGSSVEREVLQSAWNIDKMDGIGASGANIDWSKTQIFYISFQWLGVGSVWFGIEHDGRLYTVHRMDHANYNTTVSFSKPNLPVRYDIQNDGTGPAASLVGICSTVVSSGGVEETGLTRAVFRTAVAQTSNDGDFHPVIAIRLKSGYEHAVVRFRKLTLNCASNADYTWQLVLNPTIVGTALSFVDVADDAVQMDVTVNTVAGATDCTGGTVLDAGSDQQNNTGSTVNLITSDPRMGTSLTGVADIIVVAVRRDTGTNESFYGSLSWRTEQ